MEEFNVEELIEMLQERHDDYGWGRAVQAQANRQQRTVDDLLADADDLLQSQEQKWRNVTTKLVQLKYSRQVEILMSSRRPDVDIYFDDQDGKRHFLVRNHESKTPWQDAFGVLREAVRDNQKLTVRKKDNSRIGKALFKS